MHIYLTTFAFIRKVSDDVTENVEQEKRKKRSGKR